MSIENILRSAPVVPVVVIDDLADAVPLAQALYNGGLRALEITLRTPVAAQAVKLMKQALPDAYVGTGTVINRETFEASIEAGADFMVSPGVNDELLALAANCDTPFLPGAATPSEVMKLAAHGFKFLKFFDNGVTDEEIPKTICLFKIFPLLKSFTQIEAAAALFNE